MVVRIEFDVADVNFLRDAADTKIKEIKKNIEEVESGDVDYIANLQLDLYKSNLDKWTRIFEKCQKTLKRKGWA